MNCPVCDSSLRTIDKLGVQVEICPECKGIWLDRGELEKILEMAASHSMDTSMSDVHREARPSQSDSRERNDRYDDHDERHEPSEHDRRQKEHDEHPPVSGHRRNRSSWLGEILGSLGGDD